MRLTPDALVAKWEARFAPNDQFRITAADLQEFTRDVAATFGTGLANVPAYVAGTDYPLGYLVRYGLPGGRESFYYALQAGQLPTPTLQQTSASWKLMPPPISEVALHQYLTLDEAGAIEGNAVVAGRRYGVVGKWNSSADDQLVYLDGLENYFRKRGTVLHDDGSQQEVEASVGLGTYQPATGGGGLVETYLQLDTVSGLRVVELPVPAPCTLVEEVFDHNATALRYQLDTHTRTGSRVYGSANQTLAQVAAQLAALAPGDYAAGVKLYAATSAFSVVDEATVALRVRGPYALSLGGRARAAFPQPAGAQGLLLNPYFADPFTGDEATGWQVNGGWNRDAALNLAVAQGGQYLYQRVSTFVPGAAYQVQLTLVDGPAGPVSGPLYFVTQNAQSTPVLLGNAPGSYTFTFTAVSATDRVHLVGGGAYGYAGFSGAVSHFDIVRL